MCQEFLGAIETSGKLIHKCAHMCVFTDILCTHAHSLHIYITMHVCILSHAE